MCCSQEEVWLPSEMSGSGRGGASGKKGSREDLAGARSKEGEHRVSWTAWWRMEAAVGPIRPLSLAWHRCLLPPTYCPVQTPGFVVSNHF